MKWCEQYQCWCDDIDDIIEPEDLECDRDCRNCESMSEIKGE